MSVTIFLTIDKLKRNNLTLKNIIKIHFSVTSEEY